MFSIALYDIGADVTANTVTVLSSFDKFHLRFFNGKVLCDPLFDLFVDDDINFVQDNMPLFLASPALDGTFGRIISVGVLFSLSLRSDSWRLNLVCDSFVQVLFDFLNRLYRVFAQFFDNLEVWIKISSVRGVMLAIQWK